MADGTIAVDGVTYRWRVTEDDRNYSTSFSHRGVSYEDIVEITGDDGSSISFLFPFFGFPRPGWWRGSRYMTPEIAERAVRIARRTNSTKLADASILEAIDGPARHLQDELDDLSAAIGPLARSYHDETGDAVAIPLLAIGCLGHARDGRPAIDDWVASHANELAAARDPLQRMLEEPGSEEHVYTRRSAIAFLIDMCERVNLELRLETAAVDAALAQRDLYRTRPWGIPETHWWWRRGVLDDGRRRSDPRDDDDD